MSKLVQQINWKYKKEPNVYFRGEKYNTWSKNLLNGLNSRLKIIEIRVSKLLDK